MCTVRRGRIGDDRGQATVEMALMLPVVVVLALALVQVGLVVRSFVLVQHAAREGVRVAAVGESSRRIEDAVIGSTGLSPRATRVVSSSWGDRVTVWVHFTDPTDVPLIGGLFPDIVVSGRATMRRESG